MRWPFVIAAVLSTGCGGALADRRSFTHDDGDDRACSAKQAPSVCLHAVVEAEGDVTELCGDEGLACTSARDRLRHLRVLYKRRRDAAWDAAGKQSTPAEDP